MKREANATINRRTGLAFTIKIALFLSVFLLAIAGSAQTVVIGIFAGPEADAHFRLSPLFEELTGINVEVEEISRDIYRQRLLASLAGGTGEFDVVFVPFENLPEHFEAGTLTPLTPYLEDASLYAGELTPESYDLGDFPQPALDWLSLNGELYGIPQEVFTHYFHYRKDIFEELGIAPPPAEGYTWSEFVEVSRQLTRDLDGDGSTDIYGTAVPGQVSGTLGAFFITNLWRKGVELFDADMNPIPNEEAAIAAVQEYLDLINEGLVPPGVPAGYQFAQLNICMQESLCSTAIQWNAGSAIMSNPEQSPDIAGKVGFAVLPYDEELGPLTPRAFSGVHALFIANDSANKEAAFQYITWFTSPEIARITATEGGGSSGRRSILQDPEVLEQFPWYAVMNEALAKTGNTMPRIPQLGFLFNPVFATNFEAILTGAKTPEQGIRDIKREMSEALESGN